MADKIATSPADDTRSVAGRQVWRQVEAFGIVVVLIIVLTACAQEQAHRETMLYGTAGAPAADARPAQVVRPPAQARAKSREPAPAAPTGASEGNAPDTPTMSVPAPQPLLPELPRDRPAALEGSSQAALPAPPRALARVHRRMPDADRAADSGHCAEASPPGMDIVGLPVDVACGIAPRNALASSAPPTGPPAPSEPAAAPGGGT